MLKLGLATRKVTPEMGVALAGYGLKPERTVQSVMDDLFARAIVFDDGSRKVALASVDVCLVSAALVQNIRARVQAEAGIAPDAVMISATHSHSTPTALFLRNWGTMNAAFIGMLERQIGDAIIEASKSTSPVEIGVGSATVSGVAHNRVHKDGPVDETLRVLAAREPQSKLRLACAHYTCHPVVMPIDIRFASADFPGRLVRDVEKDHPGASAAFFQGALGDINPIRVWQGVDAAQDIGRTLASATRQVIEGITYSSAATLNCAVESCALPLNLEHARREAHAFLFEHKHPKHHGNLAAQGLLRDWATEMLGIIASKPPETLTIEIQALRVGDAAIVAIPAEPYTFIADAIRKASPFAHTWVLATTNGGVGYITEPRDYEEETYGALMVPKILGLPPFQPHAWEAVVASAGRALMRLS